MSLQELPLISYCRCLTTTVAVKKLLWKIYIAYHSVATEVVWRIVWVWYPSAPHISPTHVATAAGVLLFLWYLRSGICYNICNDKNRFIISLAPHGWQPYTKKICYWKSSYWNYNFAYSLMLNMNVNIMMAFIKIIQKIKICLWIPPSWTGFIKFPVYFHPMG